jgi:hypothetical protein
MGLVEVTVIVVAVSTGISVLIGGGALWLERWATKPIPEDHPAKR